MRLYNTLSKKLEEFVPGEKTVRMYVCGPTVYDLIHIGNARPFIVFDALRRYLEEQGFRMVYVQNVTDVDDKIIRRAQEEGKAAEEIALFYTQEYFADLARLGVRPPTYSPFATVFVPKMVEFVEALIKKGHAYVVDGDVYFSVRTYPGYGELSGRSAEEQLAGARVEVDERKRDPLDFALWKQAKPGEPSWPSPWGPGRPGWHTECVVMSLYLLGETLDIHAGGNDLIFPHHENERAQAESLTGKTFVRIWLHNGMLTVRGEKMAKSLGNFYYARDVVKLFGTEAVRYFYLSRHWRKPLDFSFEAMEEAKSAVARVYNFLAEAERIPAEVNPADPEFPQFLAKEKERFHAELQDDFNTPGGLAVIQEIIGEAYRRNDPGAMRQAAQVVRELGRPLGLFQGEGASAELGKLSEELLDLVVELRTILRKEKNFALADMIREKLGKLGVELRDSPEGTRWVLRT
ncbi:cysteine--tRNA ligase [Candidatus Bipolaricaulota bacterium]|nr:cysteine--tRNA ligase [Candidatus Bipolaricaulota bacterium]